MNYAEFLRQAIIETVSATTDIEVLRRVYTLLMAVNPAEEAP